AVANALVKSPEYHRVLVRGWMQTFLHRGAAASDLDYFGGLLDRGVAWVSVMRIFLSSDEYWLNRAGGNVSQYINQVYLDLVSHPFLGGMAARLHCFAFRCHPSRGLGNPRNPWQRMEIHCNPSGLAGNGQGERSGTVYQTETLLAPFRSQACAGILRSS